MYVNARERRERPYRLMYFQTLTIICRNRINRITVTNIHTIINDEFHRFEILHEVLVDGAEIPSINNACATKCLQQQ